MDEVGNCVIFFLQSNEYEKVIDFLHTRIIETIVHRHRLSFATPRGLLVTRSHCIYPQVKH